MVADLSLGLFIFALLLGIKHSMDVDHVVAVSSMLSRSPSVSQSIKLSISWALGHMITAGIITFLLFTFRETILDPLLSNFEAIVAFMLITIGILTILWEFNIIKIGKHAHVHLHDKQDHESDCNDPDCIENHHNEETMKKIDHVHFFAIEKEKQTLLGIGVIHGLASNDELLLLFTISLGFNNFGLILLGLLIFTIGVVIGMILYSSVLNISVLKLYKENIIKVINLTIASIAIVYGFYVFFGGEGINLLPFISE